jgi:hypothetical protein
MRQLPSHLIKELEGYHAIFLMHTCRSRMITPFKVNQRRITDNDDEIDFEAIDEPSGNDRMQVSTPK